MMEWIGAVAGFLVLAGTAASLVLLILTGAMHGWGERVLLLQGLATASLLGTMGLSACALGTQVGDGVRAWGPFMGFGGAAVAWAAWCALRAIRRWRIVHHGATAPGTVVNLVYRDSRQDEHCRVRYAFQGPDGVRREGVSPRVKAERADEMVQSRRVRVCFRPGDPAHHEADVFGVRRDAG